MAEKSAPKLDEVYFAPEGSPVVPHRFDARVRLRSLTRGILTLDDLKKHADSLADESSHGETRSFDALVKDESVETTSDSGTPGLTTH